MKTARYIPTLVGFIVGTLVGALILYIVSPHPLALDQARRRAIAILSQPPREVPTEESPIVSAVRRIAPTVVSLDTVGKESARDDRGLPFYIDREVRSRGSGVVISPDGFIVTNDHVIDGAERIRVVFPDGRDYYARVIGRDASNDLAVLRVPASHLIAAEFGDSDRLEVGQTCVAVGNPLGLGSTVTAGVISALHRQHLQLSEGRYLDGAIQTDAPINRGNSGGALANTAGQLIGITTAILSSDPNGGNIGLGFAIPSNKVRKIALQLIEHGKPSEPPSKRPWLGVVLGPVPENLAKELGLGLEQGAFIARVEPESPADTVGLEEGDVLLKIDGHAVMGVQDGVEAIQQHKPGDRVQLLILRPDARGERKVTITLQPFPEGVIADPDLENP